MQCANCQFENMPGTQSCARCGTSLSLGSLDLSVHPPRASARAKVIRQWLPVRRAYYRLRDDVLDPARRAGSNLLQPVSPDSLSVDVLIRLLVPGWVQWSLGNGARGGLIMAFYFPLLICGLIMFGSTGGAICLGCALAVHASSWIDLLGPDTGLLQRIVTGPIVSIVVLFLLYYAVGSVVGIYASPRVLMQSATPFTAGEVVWLHPRGLAYGTPQLGDVVMYQVPQARRNGIPIPRTTQNATYFNMQGERLDRIIAGPDSIVKWQSGQLTVDGQPSEFVPLNPSRLPKADLTLHVPQGHVAILLTTDPAYQGELPPPVWQFFSIVPEENVLGQVFLRSLPLDRWWWIH